MGCATSSPDESPTSSSRRRSERRSTGRKTPPVSFRKNPNARVNNAPDESSANPLDQPALDRGSPIPFDELPVTVRAPAPPDVPAFNEIDLEVERARRCAFDFSNVGTAALSGSNTLSAGARSRTEMTTVVVYTQAREPASPTLTKEKLSDLQQALEREALAATARLASDASFDLMPPPAVDLVDARITAWQLSIGPFFAPILEDDASDLPVDAPAKHSIDEDPAARR